MKTKTLLLGVLVALYCSCNKENPSEPPTGGSLSALTGRWSGTETIIRAGQCSISGGDSASFPVTMTWNVNNSGDVAIHDSLASGHNWSGKVTSDYRVSLRKIFTVNCFGTPTVDTTLYYGTIDQLSGTFSLTMESIEAWCPLQNCIFRVRYSIMTR
jgi:hypothetical protein